MILYIIMLTWNCVKYTQQTLGSFKTRHPHKFIIVDNASIDGTQKLLKDLSKFSNQIHIMNKQLQSVAYSWNQALKLCMQDPEFKYAYVINNDIIFERDCLDRLITFVEAHPEYVLVSGLNTRDFKKQAGKIGDGACDFAAYLITRKCIEKVGYFDENFVHAYFEDNDYHHRVKKAGLKSCVVCDVGFHHIGSRTLEEGMTPAQVKRHWRLYNRNQAYFKRKWGFLPK